MAHGFLPTLTRKNGSGIDVPNQLSPEPPFPIGRHATAPLSAIVYRNIHAGPKKRDSGPDATAGRLSPDEKRGSALLHICRPSSKMIRAPLVPENNLSAQEFPTELVV
jgi:hypothetical protein